ncbi:MAG: bacteriorhodopsin [Actinomycetota bacterium]
MPTLSETQYDIIVTAMTGATACLGAALLYFILVRSTIGKAYHAAMGVASVVVGFAAFHYLTLLGGFKDSYEHVGGEWIPTGIPFQHSLRYIDWLVTVPLLLATLVLVLRLERDEARRLNTRLMVASALMVALGYPGEVSDDTTIKLAFWAAGVVPFAYIMYLLWVELNRSLFRYSDEVGLTVARARMTLVVSWMAYPVAYLFPILGLDDANGDVLRQGIYSTADVVSKAGFGLLVYRVARILTEEDELGINDKSTRQVDLADSGRGYDSLGI